MTEIVRRLAMSRVIGFFPHGHIVSTFDQPYEPMRQQVVEF